MSMSDNVVYAQSCAVQDTSASTAFSEVRNNFIGDINNGVYNNSSSNCLVQFDLSSIYNSSKFFSPETALLVIPVVTAAAYSTAGNTAPVAFASSATTTPVDLVKLKAGYWNLINSIELNIDGKTIEQIQPNSNVLWHYKFMSECSQDYLNAYGPSIGVGTRLDNVDSIKYNNVCNATTTAGYMGPNGVNNNTLYNINSNAGEPTNTVGAQWLNTYNVALQTRSRYVDPSTTIPLTAGGLTTNNGLNLIYGTTQLQNEFRPYFQIAGNVAYWYDYAVIRLCDVLSSFKSLPLCQRLSGTIRMYCNTGSTVSTMSTASTSSCGMLIGTNTTFNSSSSCPYQISNIQTLGASASATNFVPAAANLLTVTIGVARSAQSSIGGAALIPVVNSALSSCRIYYDQVTIKPTLVNSYCDANRAKKIVYNGFTYNQLNAITAGSTYSGILQGGIRNPRGILIVPYVSSIINGVCTGALPNTVGFSQYASPYDSAPATNAPLSLINLNVSLGGATVVASALTTTYENFMFQASLYEKVSGQTLSLSNGLQSQYQWELGGMRAYYIILDRAANVDAMTPKNLTITFNNNNLVAIDCLIFTEFYSEFVIDVVTGLVKKV